MYNYYTCRKDELIQVAVIANLAPVTLMGVEFGGMILAPEVVKDDVGRYAEKAGLYVLTQTIEGGAALTNRKNFRAKEFG